MKKAILIILLAVLILTSGCRCFMGGNDDKWFAYCGCGDMQIQNANIKSGDTEASVDSTKSEGKVPGGLLGLLAEIFK